MQTYHQIAFSNHLRSPNHIDEVDPHSCNIQHSTAALTRSSSCYCVVYCCCAINHEAQPQSYMPVCHRHPWLSPHTLRASKLHCGLTCGPSFVHQNTPWVCGRADCCLPAIDPLNTAGASPQATPARTLGSTEIKPGAEQSALRILPSPRQPANTPMHTHTCVRAGIQTQPHRALAFPLEITHSHNC